MTTTEPQSATGSPQDALVPPHPSRAGLRTAAPDVYEAMVAFSTAAARGLDPRIVHLVEMRASQLNGCSFCLDMHAASAREAGVAERALLGVAVWRDTPFFTAPERAALALAEAVTRLDAQGVPDEVYDEVVRHFGVEGATRLIATAAAINTWNRFGVATRLTPAADA